MRRMIRVALVCCAALAIVLALASFAGGFFVASTPTWALTVRDLTLRGWRAPNAPGYNSILALDDSGGVGEISASGYRERRAAGFQSITPFGTKDSRRCALNMNSIDRPRALALRLMPPAEGNLAQCDSRVHFEGDEKSSPPLKAGEELRLELRSENLEFLSKPLEAETISFIARNSFAIEDGSRRCNVEVGSPVRLTGEDLRLSRAQLGGAGLAVTIEARGKVDAQVGEYCSLQVGKVRFSGWLQHLSVLVTAVTAALGILWGISKDSPKRLFLPARCRRCGNRTWTW